MTLEETIAAYHRDLADQEAPANREQVVLINGAAADTIALVDRHTDGAADLPAGWWVGVVPLVGIIGARLRARMVEAFRLRLAAVAVAAVVTLERGLRASGDDAPLAAPSPEKLTTAALAGPQGISWPDYTGRTADAMFRRISSEFRTAHTRAEVDDLVAQARRLATGAITSTVVTGLHSAANRARLIVAADSGRFQRWRYSAVLDNRTSETCIELNGTEWLFADQNAPLPPRHPNCRSIVVPLE